MPRKSFRFLEASINEIIRRRKEKLDVREDLIQYMIEREDNSSSGETKNESKDGSLKTWQLKKTLTNKEILAQSLQFLLAGYDTTATCLEFVSYHLATRKDIQERLIEEIDRVLENHVKFNDFISNKLIIYIIFKLNLRITRSTMIVLVK
jgi:cytochrome P450